MAMYACAGIQMIPAAQADPQERRRESDFVEWKRVRKNRKIGGRKFSNVIDLASSQASRSSDEAWSSFGNATQGYSKPLYLWFKQQALLLESGMLKPFLLIYTHKNRNHFNSSVGDSPVTLLDRNQSWGFIYILRDRKEFCLSQASTWRRSQRSNYSRDQQTWPENSKHLFWWKSWNQIRPGPREKQENCWALAVSYLPRIGNTRLPCPSPRHAKQIQETNRKAQIWLDNATVDWLLA